MSHSISIPDLVSIVIPAYNSEKYIKNCIESLFSQEYPSIEVIVAYDKKSTDNTLGLLKDLSKKY